MLGYLVTSKTRKALLRLIWAEGLAASIQELSSKAGVTYSAAHRELAFMEKHGLALSKGAGRAVVYSANLASPHAEILRKLLADSSEQPVATREHDDAVVVANLRRLGAPLTTSEAPTQELLSAEETLAMALVVSRRNATVLRVLPYLFARLADQVNFDEVRKRSVELRQGRALAFVLDVAAQLSGNGRLRQETATLHDRRVRKDESYFPEAQSKYERRLVARNTPALARKWHWTMNMPMESFRSVYDKHTKAP